MIKYFKATVGLIACCAITTTAVQAREVVWARDGDIDSLDPHRATSTLSRQLWYQVYDSLLEFNENGEVVPHLAREWEVNDTGTAVVFRLHDEIKCHDGSDFTASDVKWTADRALGENRPSLTKASWGPVDSVSVLDRLTVEFTLSKPFGAFIPFMADQFTSMLCESNAELTGFGTTGAIGTGPWKLVSWTQGSQIVLESNADYKNFGRPVDNPGAPYIDRLIVRTMPEAQTRVAGLRTGELQVIVPPIEEVTKLQNTPNVEVHIAESTGQSMFLEFSTIRAPFNDVRARKAVSHAINIDMGLEIVFGDLVMRERCPVARGVFGNDQDFCAQYGQDYDPSKARSLLDELDYSTNNPMEITLATWPGDSRERLLQVFQNQLQQVGIRAEIEVMDIGTLNARVKQENNRSGGNGFVDLMGWTWFDPDVLFLLWHSPGAYDGYNTPELDALLEATRTTLDSVARLKVVQDVMQHLLENAVHVPIYTPGWLWMYAVSDQAEGFKIGPFNRPLFNSVVR